MVSLFISVFFSCACRKCLDYQLVPEVMIFFICIKKYIYIYIYIFFPNNYLCAFEKDGDNSWKKDMEEKQVWQNQ